MTASDSMTSIALLHVTWFCSKRAQCSSRSEREGWTRIETEQRKSHHRISVIITGTLWSYACSEWVTERVYIYVRKGLALRWHRTETSTYVLWPMEIEKMWPIALNIIMTCTWHRRTPNIHMANIGSECGQQLAAFKFNFTSKYTIQMHKLLHSKKWMQHSSLRTITEHNDSYNNKIHGRIQQHCETTDIY